MTRNKIFVNIIYNCPSLGLSSTHACACISMTSCCSTMSSMKDHLSIKERYERLSELIRQLCGEFSSFICCEKELCELFTYGEFPCVCVIREML